ncbi:acetoacetate decarboxylase, partial [Gordonia sp. HY442]|uniref:acetoacetate decarboxylase n=1 Tax=Gordonia zhenghanii TaxID=2911516 RepID=UPI001EFF7472
MTRRSYSTVLIVADLTPQGRSSLRIGCRGRRTGHQDGREADPVAYRTDPDALRAVVPEPLTIDDPLVRFEVMKMGEVDGFGPYTESGQAIAVELDGEHGEYLRAMYLDNFAATAAGRELSAFPKVVGTPGLAVDTGALVGTLDRGAERVATATMPYKWK